VTKAHSSRTRPRAPKTGDGGPETDTSTTAGAVEGEPESLEREQIWTSALRLFGERDYGSCGIDDIAKAAGLARSTVCRHYQSKEAILEAGIVEQSDRFLAGVQEIARTSTSPVEVIKRLATNYAHAALDQPPIVVAVTKGRGPLGPDVRAHVSRLRRLHTEEWLHAYLRLRPDLAESEARLIVNAARGIIETPFRYRTGLDKEVMEGMLVDLVLKILIPEAGPASSS
jgi:AcrR family transcriptional regulator